MGDRSDPSNYRPIALLSCLSKAFETILYKWFLKHLSSFNLLSDLQHGFRKERSTGDLLAFLADSWSSFLGRFGENFAVALDISKAFDILTESGTDPYFLNYTPTDAIPSSVLLSPASFLADLFQL